MPDRVWQEPELHVACFHYHEIDAVCRGRWVSFKGPAWPPDFSSHWVPSPRIPWRAAREYLPVFVWTRNTKMRLSGLLICSLSSMTLRRSQTRLPTMCQGRIRVSGLCPHDNLAARLDHAVCSDTRPNRPTGVFCFPGPFT
jgi:hypothetical protein